MGFFFFSSSFFLLHQLRLLLVCSFPKHNLEKCIGGLPRYTNSADDLHELCLVDAFFSKKRSQTRFVFEL